MLEILKMFSLNPIKIFSILPAFKNIATTSSAYAFISCRYESCFSEKFITLSFSKNDLVFATHNSKLLYTSNSSHNLEAFNLIKD